MTDSQSQGQGLATMSPSQASQQTYPPAPLNIKSPPFPVLAKLFDNLAGERKQDLRRKRLQNWFNGWRRDAGKDLYPVLRLLLPQEHRERSVYGLKEANLAKAYIKLIPLGSKDPDAVRLLNWKKPTQGDKTAGDFPTVLYEVVRLRSSVTEGRLSIDQVNDLLDELSSCQGKQDLQSKVLQRIYNSCTPDEQKWITRIILKDMQISVKETTVFSVFHPDAVDLYNTCSDLKKVAYELFDPTHRLNEADKEINLFQSFSPMLCKRPGAKLEDLVRRMQGKPFIIEEKLDGERMQLHKRGEEYFYCSRKGKVYTYLYGAHAQEGSLTPYISECFDERIDDIVLDGEMLVWDPVSERNLPFGTLKTAALDKSKGRLNPRPCFKVFDLLFINGTSLAKRSLKFRKRNLRAYVKELKGRLEFAAEFEGRSVGDIQNRLDQIMSDRGEGLIVKHPNSAYILNGRNKDWVKVKPEYIDNMGETLDVLVIGANYGTGKRSGGASTFICGVQDDRGGPVTVIGEMKYSTFVRIGTGLTFADYVWIRQRKWKLFDKNDPPAWYQASKKGIDDKPDIYLEPEDSFILKVKAAEIIPSDQYHLGLTMRFPRALTIREDLTFADCMYASAILESMRAERKRKMEEPEQNEKKKKKKTEKKPISVMPEYRSGDLTGVAIEDDIFKGLKFVVASDPRNRRGDEEKRELLKLIRSHGGQYLQVAKGLDPMIVIYGGTSTPYDIKLIMQKDIHDIVLPSWIYDCVDQKKLIPLSRRYFFHASSDRKRSDEYIADSEENSSDAISERGPQSPDKADEPDVSEVDIDPSLADWFKVDREVASDSAPIVPSGDDSETDPDSDYEEAEGGDWLSVVQANSSKGIVEEEEETNEIREEATHEANEEKMGEEGATELDPERIFRHLCFYLDSPSNAEKNGMHARPKHREEIENSFKVVEQLIIANGGRIGELDGPKMTHVVLDKRDVSRRKELIQRTAKPKRRNLILSDFIHACVEEDSLLDEEGFAP